jgi:hypothetical protein
MLTGLRNANDVVTKLDCRNAILLDRGRDLISTKLNVAKGDRMKTTILELGDGVDASRALLDELNLGEAECVSMEDQGKCRWSVVSMNLRAEVDSLRDTVLWRAKELKLKLRVLGTDIAGLTIPIVACGAALPLGLGFIETCSRTREMVLNARVSRLDRSLLVGKSRLHIGGVEGVGLGSLTNLGVNQVVSRADTLASGVSPARHCEMFDEESVARYMLDHRAMPR